MLLGLDHATQKTEFTEITPGDIESLPYAEAVEYLKKRDVIKKIDYYALSNKLKFRAFTASRIADGDLLERINRQLIRAVEYGSGMRQFLSLTKDDLLDKVGMGPGSGAYWETVYRTNVQTSYNVGRAIGFNQDKPIALELVAIDDMRTSNICQPYAANRVILPYNHPFWDSHWPPLHFNCRTVIRAIYDKTELPESYTIPEQSKAAKGFGGYPLTADDWWDELKSQIVRAKSYEIQNEILKAKKILIESKEALGSLKDFDFYKIDIRDDDKNKFEQEYEKSSIEARRLIAKFGKSMRMDCYASTGGYYSPMDNKIHFNINKPRLESTAIGYTKNMVTYYHEFGHWLDWNALGEGKGIRDALPNLKKLLETDILDYINKSSGGKIKIKGFVRNSYEQKILMQNISREISENASTNSNISDIFEGVTNGKITDGYGHGKAYWKRRKAVEKEAIAEMFETLATGGIREEAMRKYLPNAYSYFRFFIKGLLE